MAVEPHVEELAKSLYAAWVIQRRERYAVHAPLWGSLREDVKALFVNLAVALDRLELGAAPVQ